MTLTDRASKAEESPWEGTEDTALEAFCRTGEDLLLTIDLRHTVNQDHYEFEMYRGEPPMPSDRFRVEARGNKVQLTLQHASKGDAGHYALIARRLARPGDKTSETERLFSRRVHMSVDEPSSYAEEGDPPLFLRRLTDLTVKVGTRTRFLVEIRSATDVKVIWHRNDEPIQTGPRFSFVHEGNFYCVDVAPVTVEDQGHWTCMAENRSGRSSCTSHLNVLVPKAYKRPEFVSELRALLTETGTVSLECKVIGVPTPVLNWFKDNKEIKAGDVFALTANPDDPTSLGTYSCVARSCMGTAYSSSRVHVVGKGSREGSLKPADTLIVTGEPPIFTTLLKDESCRIGESILLSCRVKVPPWPKEITWYNKEGRVEAGERYKIIEDGLGGYSIQVNPVEAVDEGEWKCVATSADNVKQLTTCFVAMSIPKNYRKPRFMESLKAVLTDEGLVSFECKVVGFPTPLLRWFKDGQELKPGDVYQLTGTNSLGSYCCVASSCMGEARSTAELTVEDIQNQLNEEERLQLLTTNQPPKFIKGLRSTEAKISENFRFSVQVSVMPEPILAWYRDDHPVEKEEKYRVEKETLGICHLEIKRLEFCDQAEWKCVASNDFGQSVTSCFLKLIIPKHYKKPVFLENLRAIMSEGGAVNLECKVIGVPQPVLKWYKDGKELKPGDIHRITSGQDGTCCLGTYTVEASSCMGSVSSSASLLGFEDRVSSASTLPMTSQIDRERELARHFSLSTIHEERTSQLLDTAQTDHSMTVDDKGDVSFSFDGKEISVSLYETPDLTEEDALKIVEMYADQLSENVTEQNVVELPPMRFVKESSTSGNLLMEAVVIDVSPDYFVSLEEGDDLRTEADLEDLSIIDGVSLSSPPLTESFDEGKSPQKPPRRKSGSISSKVFEHESESYHSARGPTLSKKKDGFDFEIDMDSEAFADALSSVHTKAESSMQADNKRKETKKRSMSKDLSLDIDDPLLDSVTGMVKKERQREESKKKRKIGETSSFEESLMGGEDEIKHRKSLETKVSFEDEEERPSSRSNKERLVELLRQISDPVLVIREALIDSDYLSEDEEFINAFLTNNVVIPVQNLCEIVADIETKALKNAGDRSLVQNMRISLLETIGGPTEELLRGLELIKRQDNVQTNLSIMESLIDPVDEILFGLSKFEYELSGRNVSVSPVILERTIQITDQLGSNLEKVNAAARNEIISALQIIHNVLKAYLSSITLNQFGGWTENIDAVLVESLSRPLEDLERSSKCMLQNNLSEETYKEVDQMSYAFNEILSRLDALVVALEGYESDYRTAFVVNLKTSLVAAAEQLSKSKLEKNEDFDKNANLPEIILDPLIDVQSSVNAVLGKIERIDQEKASPILQSELALSLAELRNAVSFAVHKTTTLKKDETINALSNLKEPLIDLQLSLTMDPVPEELNIIKDLILPLDSLENIVQTVIQNAQTFESINKISDAIQPIHTIIKELQQHIPMIIGTLDDKSGINIQEVKSFDEERSMQQVVNSLRMASELSTVHFELATIMDKCEKTIGNIESSRIFQTVSDLRQIIGNTAISTDKISMTSNPNIESLVDELSSLKEPLLKFEDALITEDSTLQEQKIAIEIIQPIERLKAVMVNFADEIIQTEEIHSIIDVIDGLKKDIVLHTRPSTKTAVEEEYSIISESYSSADFDHRNLLEKAELQSIKNQDEVDEGSLEISDFSFIERGLKNSSNKIAPKDENILSNEPNIVDRILIDENAGRVFEIHDEVHKRSDKISDKHVIYPKEEFALIISQSLQEIQQDISEILDEFEQEFTSHPVSRLAEALENLRRTILVVRSNISHMTVETSDEKSESSHAESCEGAEKISLSLKELLQPILEVREALSQTQDHGAPEVLLLNRLDQPIRAIEFNVLQLALEAHSYTVESEETSSRVSLDAMARVLEDIEFQIPLALDEVSSRQEILSTLRNIFKPLDIINEKMHEIPLDTAVEDNLEIDIANVLITPIGEFRDSLNELYNRIETADYHDESNKNTVSILKYLIEPLVELQSSLSVVKSCRKTSISDTGLLDERKNVMMRAVEEVRFGISKIRNEINNTENMSILENFITTSVDALDSAIVSFQNQISKANYQRRQSCLETLQQRSIIPLQKLGEKITIIKEKMDKPSLDAILQPLETLSKQIQLAQIQFSQSSDQPLDEEAIIEGFLYPAKHLLSSLESVKQDLSLNLQEDSVSFLQELGECTSNLASTFLKLQNELTIEGANEKFSVIETLSAVTVPLNSIKQTITEISKNYEDASVSSRSQTVEQIIIGDEKSLIDSKTEKPQEDKKKELDGKLPTILTTVETIVDEFIEVSKQETESLITLKFATEETISENEKESFSLIDLEHKKLEESPLKSIVHTESAANKSVEKDSVNIIESLGEIPDRRHSITASWSMIIEPLNNLQQSILTIIETPTEMSIREPSAAQSQVIMQRLTDLYSSIAAMQQIVSDNSEQITLTSWQEKSLPAMKNLAVALEKLGEHLPILADQNMEKEEISLQTSEMIYSSDVSTALKTLIAPLHDLKERLGLIVQEQVPYDLEISEIDLETIKTRKAIESVEEITYFNPHMDEQPIGSVLNLAELQSDHLISSEQDIKSVLSKYEEVKVTNESCHELVVEKIVSQEGSEESDMQAMVENIEEMAAIRTVKEKSLELPTENVTTDELSEKVHDSTYQAKSAECIRGISAEKVSSPETNDSCITDQVTTDKQKLKLHTAEAEDTENIEDVTGNICDFIRRDQAELKDSCQEKVMFQELQTFSEIKNNADLSCVKKEFLIKQESGEELENFIEVAQSKAKVLCVDDTNIKDQQDVPESKIKKQVSEDFREKKKLSTKTEDVENSKDTQSKLNIELKTENVTQEEINKKNKKPNKNLEKSESIENQESDAKVQCPREETKVDDEKKKVESALWFVISEPLYELQEILPLLIEAPKTLEALIALETTVPSYDTISECLLNLKISIDNVQKTKENSEHKDETALENDRLQALQNLGMILENLELQLPTLSESLENEKKETLVLEDKPLLGDVSHILQLLLAPLQKLRDRLQFITEEQNLRDYEYVAEIQPVIKEEKENLRQNEETKETIRLEEELNLQEAEEKENEKRQQEEAEKAKAEQIERDKEQMEEKLRLEEETKEVIRLEEELSRKRAEEKENEKRQQEEAEKAKAEQIERDKKEMEERLRQEEETKEAIRLEEELSRKRAEKEENEKRQQEEAEKAKAEQIERDKKEMEERLRQEEETKEAIRLEEELSRKRAEEEENEKRQQEEAEKAKAEQIERDKKEIKEKLSQEEEMKEAIRLEEELRRKRAEEEENVKRQQEEAEKAKAAQMKRDKEEMEEKLRLEEETKEAIRLEEELRRKRAEEEENEKRKQEEAEKAKAAQMKRDKEEMEEKLRLEEETKEAIRLEEELRRKRAEEEENEKRQQEEAEKAKAEQIERDKKEIKEKLSQEEEMKEATRLEEKLRRKKAEEEENEKRKQEEAEKAKAAQMKCDKEEMEEKLRLEEETKEAIRFEEDLRRKRAEKEENEKRQQEKAEKAKAEQIERDNKEMEERLRQEEETKEAIRLEVELSRKRAEEEENKKRKQEEAEKAKAAQMKRDKEAMEEKLRQEKETKEATRLEEELRRKRAEEEEIEKRQQEEAEKAKAEQIERDKEQMEEKLRLEEETNEAIRLEEELSRKRAEEEENEKRQQEEAEKAKAEQIERDKKEMEEKLRQEKETKEATRLEEELRRKRAEEEEIEKRQQEEAEKVKAQQMKRDKEQMEEKLRLEEEMKETIRLEEELSRKRAEEEENEKRQQEEAEKAKAEQIERDKEQMEEKRRQEEETKEATRLEEELSRKRAEEEENEKRQQEEAEKAKAEQIERDKKEMEKRLRQEEETKEATRLEEELSLKRAEEEENEKRQQDEAEKVKAEQIERDKKEMEERLRQEEETKEAIRLEVELSRKRAEEEENKKRKQEEAEKAKAAQMKRDKEAMEEKLRLEEETKEAIRLEEELRHKRAEEEENEKRQQEEAEKAKAAQMKRDKKEMEEKLRQEKETKEAIRLEEELKLKKAQEEENKMRKQTEVKKVKNELVEHDMMEKEENLRLEENEEKDGVKLENDIKRKKSEEDELKIEDKKPQQKEAEKTQVDEVERMIKDEASRLVSEEISAETKYIKKETQRLKEETVNITKEDQHTKTREQDVCDWRKKAIITEEVVSGKRSSREESNLKEYVISEENQKDKWTKNKSALEGTKRIRNGVDVARAVEERTNISKFTATGGSKMVRSTENLSYDRYTIESSPKTRTFENLYQYTNEDSLSCKSRLEALKSDYHREMKFNVDSNTLNKRSVTCVESKRGEDQIKESKMILLNDRSSPTLRDEVKKIDFHYNRNKNLLSNCAKFNFYSSYDGPTIRRVGSPISFDYKKSSLCDLSRLKHDVLDPHRLYPNRKNTFLSKSREDLPRSDKTLRSSYPSLFSGTSILDLTTAGRMSYGFDFSKKYRAYSNSFLQYELEPKKKSYYGSHDNIKKEFERPTYTPKSFNSNDYSLSVSESLALSRSRRRFESRNPTIIYEGKAETKSSKTRLPDRMKGPTFCTKLTNCTVAEGSHIRLMCTVIGQPEPQVHWTKNGDRIRPGGRERVKYENGIATLEIISAELEDAGYYTCVATDKNSYGQSTTEATVRIYSTFEYSPLRPTFTSALRDKYRLSDKELILETRVRGQPTPSVSWLKDERLLRGGRYRQSIQDDGFCRLHISNPDVSDSGQYVCKASNDKNADQIHHMVHFDDFKNKRVRREHKDYVFDKRIHDLRKGREKLPKISTSLSDYKVPAGGTIALQVEIKDTSTPNVTWLRDRGERKEIITSPKIRTYAESGVYTLVVPEATEGEAGTYIARVSNAYGHVDTSATVEVIPLSKFDDLGKPAMFISRPVEKEMYVTSGEPVSISFRMSGTPRPRVVWMKGIRDITDGPRSHKEIIDDYVRLTLNRVNSDDEGTYCILVKNIYGCDRLFFTLKIKQRARSLTPTAERLSLSDRLSDIHIKEQESYLRDVPGPISTEPIVTDGGRNWLSLSWGKADQRGPAPVIAYRVDAWQLGGDGGARWVELGISPINSFDAFNLRPGGEYKFRVTPRNRYGWGESVTMKGSATVSDNVEIPEFVRILPGQLKALAGTTVNLECEVRSDSKFDVKWLREATVIDSSLDSKYVIKNEKSRCSLVLENVSDVDTGRYICQVSNKAGQVSSYGRVLVVCDPKILSADERLKKRFFDGLLEDGPPCFTMRLRDRRVQTSYPVRLTCQVHGYPAPEISWFKDGMEIHESSTRSMYNDESHFHTLEITRSSLEDSGTYEVCAKNANGSVSCRCMLVVDKGIRAYIAPEFLYGLDIAYTVKLGGELRLTAQIEAYPSVGVAWHRDGIRLRPSRRAAMSLSHDGTVELVLAKITARDAGVYTVVASNEVGKAETSTTVSIVGSDDGPNASDQPQVLVNPPDTDVPYSKAPLFVTKPLSTEAQEGDTVIIQCEVVGDPKPEVAWLRDFLKPDYYRDAPHFRRVGDGPQYSLEIPHAKLDYTGAYSVVARNEHGEAKAVISLQIYAKGLGKGDSMDQSSIKQSNVLSVPVITKELKDMRCCDGDAVTLECKVYAPSETPNIRWEKSGKPLVLSGDFSAEFNGETAKLAIRHVYPEDEGEYTCVALNELGKAFTSACLVVDVPEGKENVLSQPRLTRPQGLLSANSTPRSTPRSTPVRSLSPGVTRGRELKALNLPRRIESPGSLRYRKPKFCPPKFYTIPHNRVAEEGETIRFQCSVTGHPIPWCSWDKDGEPVTPSARISIKEKDDIKTLEIAEVTLEDAGLYRVTLENDVGRTEASARLEVINRNTLTSHPIRTRSASPRTYPTFNRSLLGTTTRLNGCLQLQCDIRGSPSPSTTWFRNGTRLERSPRIKRSFIGERATLEISGVTSNDAGEYICEAKNLLGTTRSSCKVEVLDAGDPSTRDCEPPKFLQTIPSDSIVMEGHSYELQARISGTPPFSIIWLKDGHEIVDSDYYRHVIYEDGGVALRFLNVHPLDAGDYTLIVKNQHGQASCRGLFIIQDYKSSSPNTSLKFAKIPVPVFAKKGETACFCARIQCDRSIDIDWTINGKSVREDSRCKIERDGMTSILRIPSVSQRDCGEVRCIVSISRGPSISSSAQLRLKPSSPSKLRESFLKNLEPRSRSLSRIKDEGSQKTNSSTSSLRIDGNKENGKKRASSFTRLTSRTRESSMESVREKSPLVKQLPNGLLSGRSFRKTVKTDQTHPKGNKARQENKSKFIDTKPMETTTEPIKKVHVNIRPADRVSVPEMEVDEIDESIIDILAKENIIVPIESNPSNEEEEVVMETNENNSSKTAHPVRKSSREQIVLINRISSTKNSRCSPDFDIIDTKHHNNNYNLNNNNNNNKREEKYKQRSVKENRTPLLRSYDRKLEKHIVSEPKKKVLTCGLNEVPAMVIRPPDDVVALRGSTIELMTIYQGYPEPYVKWMRAGRELVLDERTHITSGAGLSRLTLNDITADQAGKYAIALENALGSDCRFVSVAVEGPPEPPCDPPIVSPVRHETDEYGANVTWCSPAYDGGCALTGYTVEYRRIGELSWRVVAENCYSLGHEVWGLRAGATYLFRVRAVNVHGPGEPSPESRPFKLPFIDMDDAVNKLKVEEDLAIMEDENDDPDAMKKIVVSEERHLFQERYSLHEELGKGRYGVVRRVIENQSKKPYAAKFVRTIKSSDRQLVREEMKIMNMLRHPKLLRLTAAFESPKEIVMITEYISGGELFERVVADDFTLTEKDSILFMRQICEGVKYMHENNVVHLDLKPENILCHTRTSHRIKLIDFGLAQILTPKKPTRVLFGTPEFIPPEIINYEPISTESDMWSVGVICYVLLTGLSPFMGSNDAETFSNIVRADYDFEDESFDAISPDAKDFISNLLQKKKELRMSAKQCLSHSWLAQHMENMSRVVLPKDKLKTFVVRRKWQKTGNALRALGRLVMLSANRRDSSVSSTTTRQLSHMSSNESMESETDDDSFGKGGHRPLGRSASDGVVIMKLGKRKNSVTDSKYKHEVEDFEEEENGIEGDFVSSSKELAHKEPEKDICEISLEKDVRNNFEFLAENRTNSSCEGEIEKEPDEELNSSVEVTGTMNLPDMDGISYNKNGDTSNTEIKSKEKYREVTEQDEELERNESSNVDDKDKEKNNLLDLSGDKKAYDAYNIDNNSQTKETEKINFSHSNRIRDVRNSSLDSDINCNSATTFVSATSSMFEGINQTKSPKIVKADFKKSNSQETTKDKSIFQVNKDSDVGREQSRRNVHRLNSQFEAKSGETSRLDGSPSRSRPFLQTGTVSRTAKLFEKLETESSNGSNKHHHQHNPNKSHHGNGNDNASQVAKNVTSVAPSDKERIQKTFDYWKKEGESVVAK